MFTVLFEDTDLIVVNKPAGIPTQRDLTGDLSLLEMVEKYAGKSLFLANRLDRPTSGLVLLGKTAEVTAQLNQQFQNRIIEKKYWAVVSPQPPQTEGPLVHFIQKKSGSGDESIKVKAYDKPVGDAKKVELRYVLRGSSTHYFLLEIDLMTGRLHQIRAQLAAIGCPIKGDVKYGARRSNPDRSIHLHARELRLKHPRTREALHFTAPVPQNDALWLHFEQLQNEKPAE